MTPLEIKKYIQPLYRFEDLPNIGVKEGQIIAYPGNFFECGIGWNYVLLRNGFPKEFNTALCCYRDPRYPERVHCYQIGFCWSGKTDSLSFRLVTDKEKEDFIIAWVNQLKTPFIEYNIWSIDEYAQIYKSIVKYKLITSYKASKLNKELMRIHGIDISKESKNWI